MTQSTNPTGQSSGFNFDSFTGGASDFLKGFMKGRGMNTSVDDDEDDDSFEPIQESTGLDLSSTDRSQKYATQMQNATTNRSAQDYIRGVQQGDFYNKFSLGDVTTTSTVPDDDDATTSIADEISNRSTTAFTNATADDADDVDTSTLDIFKQTASNVDTTINTDLPTDDEKTVLENFQINTLNSATENDPALEENFGNPDTTGLAIYEDNEDTGINVNDRLTENNVDINASQYVDSGNEIDINATGAVEEELRTRQNDAYGEATENDPWDATYNPEGASGDYDPQANEDNYNRITPPVDNNIVPLPHTPSLPDSTPDTTPDPGDNPTPPVTTPDPGDDLGIGDEVDERDQYITDDQRSQTLDMNTMQPIGRQIVVDDETPNNNDGPIENLPPASRDNDPTSGRRSQTLDMNTMQPIGRQGVVNDETTNVQQQGSAAAEEINAEAETRDNQLALQSNEVVAAGGADTALMQQPEATVSVQQEVESRPEYAVQGFKDQAQMDRFDTGYADYLDSARKFGRNINEGDKDKYKKSFFDIYEPAYEQDQKTQAHNSIIDEAKQRGVDTGVFKNVGDVNEWIGRLNKKQAGKFVAYGDEAKENYLIENKLDTMKYNQI